MNLNGDDKRFWLGRLENINDNKMNNSTSLNPEFFAEKFELNDDYQLTSTEKLSLFCAGNS